MSTPAPEPLDVALEWYVKANASTEPELVTFAAACHEEASELVERHIGTATVPEAIMARAVLEVGADLFYRRAARNGVVNFGNGVEAASVVRINRDPMTQAYPLLSPYVGLGFA